MPPKNKLTREEIINAAFELVRAEGFAALTARALAARLQVSTSPIFVYFKTMEELKPLIFKKIAETLVGYQSRKRSGRPFFDMGLGYIAFAREEKKLFQELFASGQNIALEDILDDSQFAAMKSDPDTAGLSDQALKDIFQKMWIFVHGMAVLAHQDALPSADDAEQNLLNDVGGAVISFAMFQEGLIKIAPAGDGNSFSKEQ